MAVFEPPIANSGLPGGKFIERRQVKKGNGSKVWLRARDLYVGAVLEVGVLPLATQHSHQCLTTPTTTPLSTPSFHLTSLHLSPDSHSLTLSHTCL